MPTMQRAGVAGLLTAGLTLAAWWVSAPGENVTERSMGRVETRGVDTRMDRADRSLPNATVAPASGAPALETPPGVLLVGTQTEGTAPMAVFYLDGQSTHVPVGETIGASPFVLRRVTRHGAWVSEGSRGVEREIVLRPAVELAEALSHQRQMAAAAQANPELSGRALPAQDLTVQRAESGTPLPADMQVHVRRRERRAAGQVGAL